MDTPLGEVPPARGQRLAADFVQIVLKSRGDLDLTGATITGNLTIRLAPYGVRLRHVSIEGELDLWHAVVDGSVDLTGVEVKGAVIAEDAKFGGGVYFGHAKIDGRLRMLGAKIAQSLNLSGITILGSTTLDKAEIGEDLIAEGANFSGDFSAAPVLVSGLWDSSRSRFSAGVWIDTSTSARGTKFAGAHFHEPGTMGDTLSLEVVNFDGATWYTPIDLRVSAKQLSMVGADLQIGGRIDVRMSDEGCEGTSVILRGIRCSAPLVIAGAPRLDSQPEAVLSVIAGRATQCDGTIPPWIPAVSGVDLGKIALIRIDLSRCSFAASHNLDALLIDDTQRAFGRTPQTRRWTTRRIVAEERYWRLDRGDTEWERREVGSGVSSLVHHGNVAAGPNELAEIYRALRRGRERAGDQPGAADFYYGEMEMRRASDSTPAAERALLWLYWITSGYGLRASRALIALLATVAVFGLTLWAVGFNEQPSFPGAMLFSAEGTSSLFRAQEELGGGLTQGGEALQLALRLLGPLFFGLVLLAVRGRVKR